VYACGVGDDYYFDNVSLAQVLAKSGEEQITEKPTTFLLEQNFPNPFNPSTTIRFQMPNDGHVSLKVFDLLGREVATLVNETRTAGVYDEVFNASSLASGIYVYRLQAGDYTASKKLILLR
jgi:glucuronoarabinoxylan endo-1,4-beta-xylanase